MSDVVVVKKEDGKVKLPLLIETKTMTTCGSVVKKRVRCLALDNYALIIEQLFKRGNNIKLEVKEDFELDVFVVKNILKK